MESIVPDLKNIYLGILIALAGYGIPQALIREHPKKWSRKAQLISGICVAIGIGLALATK